MINGNSAVRERDLRNSFLQLGLWQIIAITLAALSALHIVFSIYVTPLAAIFQHLSQFYKMFSQYFIGWLFWALPFHVPQAAKDFTMLYVIFGSSMARTFVGAIRAADNVLVQSEIDSALAKNMRLGEAERHNAAEFIRTTTSVPALELIFLSIWMVFCWLFVLPLIFGAPYAYHRDKRDQPRKTSLPDDPGAPDDIRYYFDPPPKGLPFSSSAIRVWCYQKDSFRDTGEVYRYFSNLRADFGVQLLLVATLTGILWAINALLMSAT